MSLYFRRSQHAQSGVHINLFPVGAVTQAINMATAAKWRRAVLPDPQAADRLAVQSTSGVAYILIGSSA